MADWDCPHCDKRLGTDVFPIVEETTELTTHNYVIGLEGHTGKDYIWKKGNPSHGSTKGAILSSEIICSGCFEDLSPELVMGYLLTRKEGNLIEKGELYDPNGD